MKAKTTVMGGLLVAVLVVGLAVAETVKVPNTGITIETLPGWKVEPSPEGGALIVIKDKPLGRFQAMINLVAEDLYGKDADSWLNEYKADLAQAVKDLHIIKQGPIKLGSVDYLAIEFRGMQGKAMLHWLQVIHIQEGRAWIFTGTSLERYADVYMPKFQKTFSTIYFPPPPPADFVASTVSDTGIQLNWTDVSMDEVGFVIQRRDAMMGTWQNVATAPPDSISWVDEGLTCATEYRYRIKSLNPRCDSNWSGEIAGTTDICPPEEPPMQIEDPEDGGM